MWAHMNEVAAKAGLTAEGRISESVSWYAEAALNRAWERASVDWEAEAGLRVQW